MTRPDAALDAYFEDALTADEARAIDAWIAEDPAHAKALLHLVQTHRMLGIVGKENKLARETAQLQPETLDMVTLASLARMEAEADPITLEPNDHPLPARPARQPRTATDPGLLQAIDDLRWAAGKAAVRLIRSPFGITGAVAALLLIGLLLLSPWSETEADRTPGTPTAMTPSPPAGPTAPIAAARTVATLTAVKNAQWSSPQAEGASAPGSPLTQGSQLTPGQRLTLTAGFAEITTARGAVAILEAPTTIELIDNDNAIRLHAGKLVGICETESSKGFLIRTPHMDITDLGTRFGVDASSIATQTHVFEGEVAISLPGAASSTPPVMLTSGQSRVADTFGDSSSVAFDPNRFVIEPVVQTLRPDFAGTRGLWLGPVAGDLGQDRQTAEALQVFIEQRGLVLDQAVGVDMTSGAWDHKAQPGTAQVAAGERVDVYLLHFDLPDGHEVPEDFVLDFGRPILGVIANQPALDATDATLGKAGVAYPDFSGDVQPIGGPPRGLNAFGAQRDHASVDADGTTLRLSLWGGNDENAMMDQVRVIVRAADPGDPNR